MQLTESSRLFLRIVEIGPERIDAGPGVGTSQLVIAQQADGVLEHPHRIAGEDLRRFDDVAVVIFRSIRQHRIGDGSGDAAVEGVTSASR